MRPMNVFLVELPPEVHPAVVAAVARAFPRAVIRDAQSIAAAEEAAARAGPTCGGLVIWGAPEEIAVESRRCPTVALAGLDAGSGSSALLAQLFRQALVNFELQRENHRLAGDLRSVARRVRHDLLSPVGSLQIAAEVLGHTGEEAIWVNLLGNALRHGGDAPVVVAWQPDSTGFRFSVTDTGPGVAAEARATLFTPFDRLHSVIAPGLGLAIVERLVALQGGTCGHERPAAGGACFYFALPAVDRH